MKRYWTGTNIEMNWWARIFNWIAELGARERWHEPQQRWWCDNCWRVVNLNPHLRCEICDSDAVLEVERIYGTETMVGDAENRNRGK